MDLLGVARACGIRDLIVELHTRHAAIDLDSVGSNDSPAIDLGLVAAETRGVENDPSNRDMPESRIALATDSLCKAVSDRAK